MVGRERRAAKGAPGLSGRVIAGPAPGQAPRRTQPQTAASAQRELDSQMGRQIQTPQWPLANSAFGLHRRHEWGNLGDDRPRPHQTAARSKQQILAVPSAETTPPRHEAHGEPESELTRDRWPTVRKTLRFGFRTIVSNQEPALERVVEIPTWTTRQSGIGKARNQPYCGATLTQRLGGLAKQTRSCCRSPA